MGNRMDGLTTTNHEIKITLPNLRMDPFHAPAAAVAAMALVVVAAEVVD